MADDLNGWLRRVRPPTAADADGWADSDAGRQSLSDIHRRVANATVQRPTRRWALLPIAAVAAAAVVALVGTTAPSLNAPSTLGPALPPTTQPHPATMLLTAYDSCDALLAGLRSHAAKHAQAFEDYGYERMAAPTPTPAPAAEAAGAGAGAGMMSAAGVSNGLNTGSDSTQTSTTNVQEAGVDEPDVVKTDGDRLVTVSAGVLRVLDAASPKIVGSLDLRQYANSDSAELLVSGANAIVLLKPNAQFVSPMAVPAGGFASPMPVPAGGLQTGGADIDSGGGRPSAVSQNSTLLYVDLSATPRVVGSLEISGSVLDARMVGSTVRVVSSSAPTFARPQSYTSDAQYLSGLRAAIAKAPIASWLPSYTVTGSSGSRTSTVPCGAVDHPADFTAASMLTVYTVDPGAPANDPQPVTIAADGNTVYATTSSLYVASSSGCAQCFGATLQSATDIHRFDISGTGKPTYLGSASVKGSLLSQYSLSDYDGSLRVATTTTGPSGATVSGVDVLDSRTLKQTGSVSGLGKGERVYAVRFIGKLGYVVTYNQQDPLYVLDLSDPAHPRLTGSLEIPGFSSYLDDAGDGRLIGVGQDTRLVSESGGQYAHNEGRMVQLFDVTDPSKPTRTAKIVLPGTGTPGDPSFDPHAFLYWPQTGLVVVPVSNDGGGALAVRLHDTSLVEVGAVSNPGDVQTSAIERSMIVDGALWTFSQSGVRVSAQTDLSRLAWIPFS